MKVLKKGTIKPTWKKLVICSGSGNGGGGCGANLEVHQEDVYGTTSYCYDGSSDACYTITCPVCGAESDIAYPPFSVPNKKAWLHKKKHIQS